MDPKAYRLPTHARPERYDVEITASPSTDAFSGRVRVHLNLESSAASVEMHARDLELTEATFDANGSKQPAEVTLHADRQTVSFRPERPLQAGSAQLDVRFSGKLNPSMHGIYLATDGTHRAVCTQCEATDARGIFPCFDEPSFKAAIGWTIRAPKDLVALSNGALEAYRDEGDERVWSFEPTPKVSSYLAALSIGAFEGTEAKEINGVPLRVYAPQGKLDQTGYALDYTARLLPWYEAYFDCAYPFGKYDQIAVPGFDAGAMENVGLVLFRQNLLLMDAKSASWRQEKLIAKVIAHEFAHMWFGNLVTMKWWDDLWLNEAFAEWMAHKAVDALSADYHVWDDFQDDKNRALVDDALPTTHPIWSPVDTPEQAIEMFDVITYQKGCAVMRMLENFLGEEPFREGLRAYMKAFEYDNAAGADLWEKLEASSGQPVKKLVESWIKVPGFPILDCDIVIEDGRSALRVSQSRFFSSASAEAGRDATWTVPMVVRYADDGGVREHRFLLDQKTQTEPLPGTGKVRWCYPNANEIGFYRVRPQKTLAQQLLSDGLGQLTAVEQLGLLEDQWAAVRNASSTIDQFVDVLEAMGRRNGGTAPIDNHNLLRGVADRIGTIDLLLRDADADAERKTFRAWARQMLAPPMAELGTEPKDGEPQNDVQRRATLLHAMGHIVEDPSTIAAAEAIAARERDDPSSVDPNLAGTCLGIAARFGDEARHAQWVQTYEDRKRAGAPPQTTLRYLYTLGQFRPEALTERTLQLIDSGVIPQEAVGSLLGLLVSVRHAQNLAWKHMQSDWETLKKRVGDMGISRLVEAVGALRYEHRSDVVSFFEANPPGGAERALARALTSMDEREELRARVTPALLARFAAR